MLPDHRELPIIEDWLAPVLLWDTTLPCADGAALACPQCGGPNLHLATIHLAVPANGGYEPTMGVSLDPHHGVAIDNGHQARQLHAEQNKGTMLSIGYQCEHGCQGRIELRQHKGHLFASLRSEPGWTMPDDDYLTYNTTAAVDEGDEPPF
jgi:hypothetical protein